MVEVKIGQCTIDGIFIIVPELIRDCILGIEILNEGECVINLPQNRITFNNNTSQQRIPVDAEILTIEINEDEQKTLKLIEEKLAEVNGITTQTKQELEDILLKYRCIFKERPGRIKGCLLYTSRCV